MYPLLEFALDKLEHNTDIITSMIKDLGGTCFAVTKVIGSDPTIAKIILAGGADGLGESRITNIKKMREAGIKAPILLLRSPGLSEIEQVIRYADISLNSEVTVLKALNDCAAKYNKHHQVILMTDLGDGREGVSPEKLKFLVEDTLKLPNLKLYGIGVNLACFSGLLPSDAQMKKMIELKNHLNINDSILISGGNSSGLHWLMQTENQAAWVSEINHWRIGESIFLGWDIITEKPLENCYQDICLLKAEVIEVQRKAVGNHESSLDTRIVIALGLDEIGAGKLYPVDPNINIIGASSDHLVATLTPEHRIAVGEIVTFRMDYQGLFAAANSRHVSIKYC